MRYPFAPLVDAMGLSPSAAARTLGMSGQTQARYLDVGMPADTAYRLADRAGIHPFEVWPELVDDEAARRRAERAAAERRRRATPEGAASHAAADAKWRDSARLYVRRRDAEASRTRRAADPDGERAANRQRWALQKDELNARRRQRYATDEAHRAARIESARRAREQETA